MRTAKTEPCLSYPGSVIAVGNKINLERSHPLKEIFLHILSFISTDRDGSWNISMRKRIAYSSNWHNITAADDLATQGARASEDMVST